LPDREVGVLQRRGPDADREVQPFLDDVDAAIGGVDQNLHLWVVAHVTGDGLGDTRAEKRNRATDPHGALWLRAGLVDDLLGGPGFGHHRKAVLVKASPGLRQRQAAAGAVQQAHPKRLFQRADAPTQFRCLLAKATGGGSEAAAIHHFSEQPKVIEVRDLIHVRRRFRMIRSSYW